MWGPLGRLGDGTGNRSGVFGKREEPTSELGVRGVLGPPRGVPGPDSLLLSRLVGSGCLRRWNMTITKDIQAIHILHKSLSLHTAICLPAPEGSPGDDSRRGYAGVLRGLA